MKMRCVPYYSNLYKSTIWRMVDIQLFYDINPNVEVGIDMFTGDRMGLDLLGIWVNGFIHRIGGPAIERDDGSYEWYIHDKKYNNGKRYQSAAGLSDSDMMVLRLKYGEI
jgi:hypothetical protein